MRKRLLLILLPLVIVVGAFVFAIVTAPQNPVAIIRVRDAAGKPVAGATVKGYAMRPKNGGADYFWTTERDVKPNPVTTDSQGIARIPYPRIIVEKLETGEISLLVSHSNFCIGGFPRAVAFSPPDNAPLWKRALHPIMVLARRVPARPDPIVLKSGGIVEVSGWIESKDKPVSGIHPQATSAGLPERDFWSEAPGGVLVTRRVEPGPAACRIAYFAKTNEILFSELVNFQAVAGQTNKFEFQLKPGVHLHGKLDDLVPRPVANGRILIQVADTNDSSSDKIEWSSNANVQPDGTFEFICLPPGRIELIGICDGFVTSEDPKLTRGGSQRVPLRYILDGHDKQITVPMERSATCEVTVHDDKGKPLEGADVYFWPNVIWGGRSSTIFAQDVLETADVLRAGERPDTSETLKSARYLFQGRTDARGIAIIRDIPSCKNPESFGVDHSKFEMPVDHAHGDSSRYAQMDAFGGVTNYSTVTMQPKGREFLQPNK